MYDSKSSTDEEWIELYNTTDSDIDISGWYITDDDVYPAAGEGDVVIPSGTTLPAGGFLVISWIDLTDITGEVICDPSSGYRTSGPRLSNDGDNIALYSDSTGSGDLVDGSLSDKYPDLSPGNSGTSIERIDPSIDFADQSNWQASYNNYGSAEHVYCTPGAENSTIPPGTPYSIYELQTVDHSGEVVKVNGIVTGVFDGSYTIQDSASAFNGIWVDGSGVTTGDEVTVEGMVSENNDLTQIAASIVNINSSGNTLPDFEVLATGSVGTEEWEGVLINTSGVCDNDSLGHGEWSINDGSGSIRVDDMNYAYSPILGKVYEVTGPLYYSFSNFKIEPRDEDDIDGLLTVVNPIPDISVDEDSPDTTLGDLNTVFDDPDDALTFSYTNSDTTLVEVIVIGDTVSLSFYPDANGDAELVFTATSTSGDSISDTVIVTVLPVNDAPQSFDLVGPVNDTYIEITPDNLNEVLTFSWGVSIDIDGDSIVYSLLGTDGLTFLSVDTVAETSIVWSYEDLAAAIDSIDVATGTWMIIASDDELNTEAGNGPFTLTIDAAALSVDKVELMPDFFALHPNYPNPFNPVTTIAYDIPEATNVRIDIYDILGQKVRTLVNSMHEAAFHKVVWNSRDDYGKSVPSGMYIYRITATDLSSGKTNFTKARKLVMIK
ncbi:MAG: lamin tail domain-containing protein [Candidatus Marinimicrobia bacterium]|nr:lamin tail domain-containing protein [Candidatus Neomarinimicrobiota bacterium]